MSVLRPLSLRTKLLAFVALLVIAFALFMLSYFPSRLEGQSRRGLESRVMGVAALLGDTVRPSLEFDDPVGAARLLRRLESIPDAAFALLRHKDGTEFARWSAAGLTDVPAQHATGAGVHFDANFVSVRVPVVGQIGAEGVLTVGFTLTELNEEIAASFRQMVVATLLVLLIGVTVALLVGAFVLRPIRQLTDAALGIAQGDPEARKSLELERHDEVGQMAAAFNSMVQRLEEQRREVELLNTQLESRVAQRTAQLASANQNLETMLSQLRATQDELLQSTRLASVGEMAGRTAHEVLNPITSIHGRLTKMLRMDALGMRENLETLADIIEGWHEVYARGGLPALVTSLQEKVDAGNGHLRSLVDEDLENLTGIRAYLERAMQRSSSDVEFLLREVDRVTHIIDGMRSLTRQFGTATVVAVDECVRDALEVVRDSAQKRNIALTTQPCPDAAAVVDRYELIQVLTNLLRNSMQAIEEKAGRQGGKVEVAVTLGDGLVELRIIDTGTGIRAEHLSYLFESNFTTRSADEGTGLGLSISRRLARGFGGELTVERTEVGVGTTMLLVIPHAKDAQRGDGATARDARNARA